MVSEYFDSYPVAPTPRAPAIPALDQEANKPDDDYFSRYPVAPPNVRAQQATLVAQDANPDAAAKAHALAWDTGVPQPAIEQNLTDFQQAAEARKNLKTLDDNPALTQFIADNPLAARMAKDDYDKLGFIEQSIDAFKAWGTVLKSGVQEALTGNEIGRLEQNKQNARLLGMDTMPIDAQIQ